MNWFSIVLLCGKIDIIHTKINLYIISSYGHWFLFEVIHWQAIIFWHIIWHGINMTLTSTLTCHDMAWPDIEWYWWTLLKINDRLKLKFVKLCLLVTCWLPGAPFYPRPVLAFGYCRCLRLSVCVSVCVRQPPACPRDNSSSVQAGITKFGP